MKKFALITGASGGIGSATAKSLAKEGWNLYLHYHLNRKKIMELIEELTIYNIDIFPIQADLSTMEGVGTLTESIFQIDAIIYASGNAPQDLFTNVNNQTIEEMLQLHVTSPLILVRNHLAKLMRNQNSQIIIISSIWGQTGAACEVIYSTVKGAQIAFVKALSKEIARSGIRVNCVAPGAVNTQMLNHLSAQEMIELAEEIPIGRIGEPEEISEVIQFLLSDKASYITGQVIAINGGWYT